MDGDSELMSAGIETDAGDRGGFSRRRDSAGRANGFGGWVGHCG